VPAQQLAPEAGNVARVKSGRDRPRSPSAAMSARRSASSAAETARSRSPNSSSKWSTPVVAGPSAASISAKPKVAAGT
jgi:hypothetical protein